MIPGQYVWMMNFPKHLESSTIFKGASSSLLTPSRHPKQDEIIFPSRIEI
jgi:hypothetical protein